MPEISFTCSDEDEAWIMAQAEELGIDDIGMTVRVIVRDARKRGVGFGIVASGPQGYADAVTARPIEWNEGNSAPLFPANAGPIQRFKVPIIPTQVRVGDAVENPLAEDFELPSESTGDEVADILAEGTSAVDAMLQTAQAPASAAAPRASYRSRAAAYRSGTAPSALRVVEGPGSRTNVVAIGELGHADPRTLAPADQVLHTNLRRQMDGHFGRLRQR